MTISNKRIAVLSSAGGGGAGIAARRMAEAINADGSNTADFIDIAVLNEALPQKLSPQDSLSNHTISDTHFTVEHSGYQRGWLVEMLMEYDLVNIHWASYLISIGEILELALRGQNILFMLHDFYYITGGCHYPSTCTQLGQGCTACPQIDVTRCPQLTIAENYRIKQQILEQPQTHLAAPSAFLRNKAVSSGIVPAERAHVLRNAYEPTLPASSAKRPFNSRILLIADSLHEGRKNMRFALEVLATLNSTKPDGMNFSVDVIGTAAPEMRAYLQATGVPHTFHGRITDHTKLAQHMAQADVMLTASLEDNWPNILVEAGSYGVLPVVGPGHGCEEFVQLYGYGVVAQDYTIKDFVEAMKVALSPEKTPDREAKAKRIRTDHSPNTAAKAFNAVFEKISIAQ